MLQVSTRLRPIGEFFLLRDAERRVRAYTAPQSVVVRRYVEAAEGRLAAGRRIPAVVPSALLLREAVQNYLRAMEAASDPRADDAALEAPDFVNRLPTLPPDPLRPDAYPTDDARVRAALGAVSPLYFDDLPAEDATLARSALERAASMLSRRVEARSLANVRGTRWGRWTALALAVAYVFVIALRAKLLPKNIARGKHVHASSSSSGDGHELVDGELAAAPGVRTNTEESPSAVIDLGKEYRVDRIAVYNRVDGWFDDCLPLVVELSVDGARYQEIARQDQHFGTAPPWTVDGRREAARYVRLRVARRGYLALSEVEVFGREP
jgi:hypothetical protein